MVPQNSFIQWKSYTIVWHAYIIGDIRSRQILTPQNRYTRHILTSYPHFVKDLRNWVLNCL